MSVYISHWGMHSLFHSHKFHLCSHNSIFIIAQAVSNLCFHFVIVMEHIWFLLCLLPPLTGETTCATSDKDILTGRNPSMYRNHISIIYFSFEYSKAYSRATSVFMSWNNCTEIEPQGYCLGGFRKKIITTGDHGTFHMATFFLWNSSDHRNEFNAQNICIPLKRLPKNYRMWRLKKILRPATLPFYTSGIFPNWVAIFQDYQIPCSLRSGWGHELERQLIKTELSISYFLYIQILNWTCHLHDGYLEGSEISLE